ncbi:hypothetical protein MTO96_044707 [Rhipicephalus appendiculatus]
MSQLRRREPASGVPEGHGESQASAKAKFNRNVRASVFKAARMPAMPLEESKIVIRPRGGVDIVKTGTTTVAAAILQARPDHQRGKHCGHHRPQHTTGYCGRQYAERRQRGKVR